MIETRYDKRMMTNGLVDRSFALQLFDTVIEENLMKFMGKVSKVEVNIKYKILKNLTFDFSDTFSA